ncbi:hypothetical protein D9M68_247830 [compost metagenome]
MLRTSAWTAAGVALAFRLITRSLLPVPPVKVPMTTPPKVTFEPETPICPAPVPSFRMARMSSPLARLATMATVTLPPSKSVESLSVTVALLPESSRAGLPPSMKPTLSPFRLPTTGASLVGAVRVKSLPVPPM